MQGFVFLHRWIPIQYVNCVWLSLENQLHIFQPVISVTLKMSWMAFRKRAMMFIWLVARRDIIHWILNKMVLTPSLCSAICPALQSRPCSITTSRRWHLSMAGNTKGLDLTTERWADTWGQPRNISTWFTQNALCLWFQRTHCNALDVKKILEIWSVKNVV